MRRDKKRSEAEGTKHVATVSVTRNVVRFGRKQRLAKFERMRTITKFGAGSLRDYEKEDRRNRFRH
jgi:hypothetical protein